MIWILALLIVVLVLDSGRMRGRLAGLPRLPASDQPVSPEHHFLTAPGVTLDEATRRAASAWARAEGLDVVDLIPGDLPAIRAMSLAQMVDPVRLRRERFATGVTTGHAMLVTDEVAARAGLTEPIADEVGFVHAARQLKRYASSRFGIVVAPAETARSFPLARRRALMRAVLGPSTPVALALQPAFWILFGLGVWLHPVLGGITLGIWHLQPLLALAGTPVRSRDLLVATVLRAPLEIVTLVGTLLGRWQPPGAPDPVASRRPEYQRLLEGGTGRFFDQRRATCPVCDATTLAVHHTSRDLLQHKPGRFTLEKCDGCGHIFQNPRLSFAGLDFYYKDFYDGLGEAGMESIFGYQPRSYLARARMVADVQVPARWLDVGAGHGHFCCVAKDALPDTRFDGLDMSESIEEAHKRGWISNAYRGLFPELAPSLAGSYEAVSMSHYLEHTLDPRQELAAAHVALAPAGHLMIEVPDPEFFLGRLLGRYWLPWFQPQHQHFLSVGNLERLLREQGFVPVEWHRGPAHTPVDFLSAVWLGLGRLAPPTNVPWRSGGAVARTWRVAVWTVGTPFLVAGWLTDQLGAPLLRRSARSNTYRVLARRAETGSVPS